MKGALLEDLHLLEPANPLQHMVWGVGALLLLLALWVLWKLLRGLRKSPQRSIAGDAREACQSALAALEQLSRLVDEGKGRSYAIESSAVIREYIEQRFGLRAPVLVTSEFLEHAQSSSHLAEHHSELLGDYLHCCDLLKFGLGQAEPGELRQIHAAAVHFVEETQYSGGEEVVG